MCVSVDFFRNQDDSSANIVEKMMRNSALSLLYKFGDGLAQMSKFFKLGLGLKSPNRCNTFARRMFFYLNHFSECPLPPGGYQSWGSNCTKFWENTGHSHRRSVGFILDFQYMVSFGNQNHLNEILRHYFTLFAPPLPYKNLWEWWAKCPVSVSMCARCMFLISHTLLRFITRVPQTPQGPNI